ncbi:hypothetical protein RHGRI_007852 [Rhododendron griersonianum]|uniref:Uncharacterized protein n=1 Tax=Rhododendron griersonianum TaxID=479676 RepID=A0AAV6KZN4_9ERIC|nr:hypothetical protein RHGRI_007852 [Rhododendron griersonianum]
MAAATAMVSVYPDHPHFLFPSLLSFLFPQAGINGKSKKKGKEKRNSFAAAMAAATTLVFGYLDHPPLLFPSLLSFLSPFAGSHRERG